MNLRPYQVEAIEAVDHSLARGANPCVVLPTGAGKTVVFGTMIRRYHEAYSTRIMVVAHVKELLQQAHDKLKRIWPQAPAGIYSAGLGQRDLLNPITIAGIQSVWRKAGEIIAPELLVVDEAHRIPAKNEGMYRTLISVLRLSNPNMRVIGYTATPFRLGGGCIAGKGRVLTEICYEANIRDLIADGYLCPITSKHGMESVDTSGISIRQGDFVQSQLAERVDTHERVTAAVAEALRLAGGRRSLVWFCVNVEHAEHVMAELRRRSERAECVSQKTHANLRERYVHEFSAGRLRHLINVNVFTEGFDAERLDCVVMLRPTASAGMYMQQVGRGLRLHAEKQNCLVLDFAGNVERHGPIDLIKAPAMDEQPKKAGTGVPPMKTCPSCQAHELASARTCEQCGYAWPENEISHATTASVAPIISTEGARLYTPDRVVALKHEKEGKRPVLRVKYVCKRKTFSEWVPLESEPGSPRWAKAQGWWKRRFKGEPPSTVDAALDDLFISIRLTAITESLEVDERGKWAEVKVVNLKGVSDAA